ncbi:MAG: twin-arginine translocation signal domain-containing protein [Pseudomonadota bacterium]
MTEKTTDESRRGFLKLAATAPVAAAATGVATQAVADEAPKSGLADTEHTRAFYASARF